MDKRRAVTTLLNDEEWAKWSDREIAKRCGVHHEMVGRLRKEFSLAESASERTYTTKHGTPAIMNIANIGAVPTSVREAVDVVPDADIDDEAEFEYAKRDYTASQSVQFRELVCLFCENHPC